MNMEMIILTSLAGPPVTSLMVLLNVSILDLLKIRFSDNLKNTIHLHKTGFLGTKSQLRYVHKLMQ